jgi:hypothetical protein
LGDRKLARKERTPVKNFVHTGVFIFEHMVISSIMPITNKDSILKLYYEANGQQEMFGRDNLQFKTVNHPTPHRLVDLCNKFKLKKLICDKELKLTFYSI